MEFLRGDEVRGRVGSLSTSQFISIFILATGVALWILRSKSSKLRPQATDVRTNVKTADADKSSETEAKTTENVPAPEAEAGQEDLTKTEA